MLTLNKQISGLYVKKAVKHTGTKLLTPPTEICWSGNMSFSSTYDCYLM